MSNDKITTLQVLFPLSLVSFVFVVFLGFQMSVLVSDRQSLTQAHDQQSKALEQVDKIKAQVNALALGTLRLAKQGDKSAGNIIAQLKQAGVNVEDKASSAPVAPATSGQAPPPSVQ